MSQLKVEDMAGASVNPGFAYWLRFGLCVIIHVLESFPPSTHTISAYIFCQEHPAAISPKRAKKMVMGARAVAQM